MPKPFINVFTHRRDALDNDIVIVVMGPPGVGKSTFINTATGHHDLRVSHGQETPSNEVRWVRCPYPGDDQHRNVVFVETPPLYEDISLQDIEKKIEQWMYSRPERPQVSGILYLQRITDRKMTQPPFDLQRGYLGLRRADLSRKLCFVTTMWSHVQESMGTRCEEELIGQWRWMLDSGSSLRRFDDTPESAWSTIRELLKRAEAQSGIPPIIGPVIGGTSELQELSHQRPDVNLQPMVGRQLDKAVVLIMGMTGHGKSKTINRLVGHNLLEVGLPISGSSTEVIQRVAFPMYNAQTGVTLTLSLDETTGGENATYHGQNHNTSLMRQYARIHFPDVEPNTIQFVREASSGSHDILPKTYPNIILLVASWDSIKEDAHNDPQHFTSAIGKTIFNLKMSRLVDLECPNVIVVVTKSVSFWQDYDDYDENGEKRRLWNNDARKKTGIIGALQRKIFPLSRPWRVVFVENGGGRAIPQNHTRLPNGELSHQNLFEAIRDLFIAADTVNKPWDRVGLQALCLLTGAETLRSQFECDFSFLKPLENIVQESANIDVEATQDIHSTSSFTSDQLHEIAYNVLGFTYNPIYGNLGSLCSLVLDQSDIHVVKGTSHQFEQIIHVNDIKNYGKATSSQLRADFEMRDIPGMSSHYPSSTTFESALSPGSHLYIARKLTAVARVVPLRPRLSAGMLNQINKLQRWSPETESDYYNFFEYHGTHVVLCVALGGVLRIILRGDINMDEWTVRRVLEAEADAHSSGATESGGMMFPGGEQVMVFLDGGNVVGYQLSRALGHSLSHALNPWSQQAGSDWPHVRMQWVNALETDPVFCLDDPRTQYWWLYSFDGLTATQQNDLRLASQSYLQARNEHWSPHSGPGPLQTSLPPASPLPRNQNLADVSKYLERLDRKPS